MHINQTSVTHATWSVFSSFVSILFYFFLSADVLSDSLSLSSQRDDHRVRVVVCVADLHVFKDVSMFFCQLFSFRLIYMTVNPCDTYMLHIISTGGQTTGFLHRHCQSEWQDGLAHAWFSCQPSVQGETASSDKLVQCDLHKYWMYSLRQEHSRL